jgi:hypothetical protein
VHSCSIFPLAPATFAVGEFQIAPDIEATACDDYLDVSDLAEDLKIPPLSIVVTVQVLCLASRLTPKLGAPRFFGVPLQRLVGQDVGMRDLAL